MIAATGRIFDDVLVNANSATDPNKVAEAVKKELKSQSLRMGHWPIVDLNIDEKMSFLVKQYMSLYERGQVTTEELIKQNHEDAAVLRKQLSDRDAAHFLAIGRVSELESQSMSSKEIMTGTAATTTTTAITTTTTTSAGDVQISPKLLPWSIPTQF